MAIFYFARRTRKLRYYGDVIHSFDWKSAVEPDGSVRVPSERYPPICNILHQWKPRSSLFIVYRLYNTLRVCTSVLLLTLGAHAHSVVVVCMCVCVTTYNCRLTHWNHKTEMPTCSQQYSDRFKFCRFS